MLLKFFYHGHDIKRPKVASGIYLPTLVLLAQKVNKMAKQVKKVNKRQKLPKNANKIIRKVYKKGKKNIKPAKKM